MRVFGVKPFTRYGIYKAGDSMRGDQKRPYGKEPEVTTFFISDCGVNSWWVAQASCSPFPGLQRQLFTEVGSRQAASPLRAGVPSLVNSGILQWGFLEEWDPWNEDILERDLADGAARVVQWWLLHTREESLEHIWAMSLEASAVPGGYWRAGEFLGNHWWESTQEGWRSWVVVSTESDGSSNRVDKFASTMRRNIKADRRKPKLFLWDNPPALCFIWLPQEGGWGWIFVFVMTWSRKSVSSVSGGYFARFQTPLKLTSKVNRHREQYKQRTCGDGWGQCSQHFEHGVAGTMVTSRTCTLQTLILRVKSWCSDYKAGQKLRSTRLWKFMSYSEHCGARVSVASSRL